MRTKKKQEGLVGHASPGLSEHVQTSGCTLVHAEGPSSLRLLDGQQHSLATHSERKLTRFAGWNLYLGAHLHWSGEMIGFSAAIPVCSAPSLNDCILTDAKKVFLTFACPAWLMPMSCGKRTAFQIVEDLVSADFRCCLIYINL